MNATTASAATTATRKTATGEKVYIHTGCSCSKINGKVLRDLETVADGQEYAADNDLEFTYCKTSQEVTEQPNDEFELTLDNTDQFGAQRRTALAAILEATGGEIAGFAGIKNKHRTGNAAFIVQVSAPEGVEETITEFFDRLEDELDEVIEEAKEHGKAEGWDSNTRQKHWKNTAREHIVAEGAKEAAELSG